MITFRCLMCSSTVSVSEEEQGATVDCPECGALLNVPQQSVEGPPPVVNRADSKASASQHKTDSEQGTGAKSIFRAKRKAQQDAEADGKVFDSSKFDQDKTSRNTVAAVVTVFVIAMGWYAYY